MFINDIATSSILASLAALMAAAPVAALHGNWIFASITGNDPKVHALQVPFVPGPNGDGKMTQIEFEEKPEGFQLGHAAIHTTHLPFDATWATTPWAWFAYIQDDKKVSCHFEGHLTGDVAWWKFDNLKNPAPGSIDCPSETNGTRLVCDTQLKCRDLSAGI